MKKMIWLARFLVTCISAILVIMFLWSIFLPKPEEQKIDFWRPANAEIHGIHQVSFEPNINESYDEFRANTGPNDKVIILYDIRSASLTYWRQEGSISYSAHISIDRELENPSLWWLDGIMENDGQLYLVPYFSIASVLFVALFSMLAWVIYPRSKRKKEAR